MLEKADRGERSLVGWLVGVVSIDPFFFNNCLVPVFARAGSGETGGNGSKIENKNSSQA